MPCNCNKCHEKNCNKCREKNSCKPSCNCDSCCCRQNRRRGRTGNTGNTGNTGPSGLSFTGATGVPGAAANTGATGNTGPIGLLGPTGNTGVPGTAANTGATGPIGLIGTTGNTGPVGSAANTGATGNTGPVGVGATGNTGPIGILGATGNTGPVGVGATGATGPSVSLSSAQYVQLGAQPATVAAGQPFTYTTTVLSSPIVNSATGIFPPFAASGTIFTLTDIGRYEINWQMTFPTDGGVVLYAGATIGTMLPLPYTMIGKTSDGQIAGSVIIETATANSFLSVNAAAGNTAAIGIPGNSSTTNMNATTVSIKKIS